MLFVTIFITTLLGVSLGAPSEDPLERKRTLLEELGDFMVAVNVDQLHSILIDHFKNDQGMQAGLKYFQGDEYRKIHKAIHSKPSTKEIYKRFNDAGLNLENYDKMGQSIIDGLIINVPDNVRASFASFLDEVLKTIDFDRLLNLLARKLESSPVFRKFYDEVTSEDMRLLVIKLMKSEEIKFLNKKLLSMDVPIDEALEALFTLIGWKKERNLNVL